MSETQSVAPISILLVGSTERSEFRDARAVLDESGRVVAAPDVPSALALLAEGRIAPEVIVVAQAYPGQFSHAAVDRMRRLAPLARVLGLLGSWCEGETRTGQPWPAAIRVYWHQWETLVRRELARLGEGTPSTWSLPITASEEERLLFAQEQPGHREGLIVVSTPEFEMQDWLRAACARRGYSSVWLLPQHPAPVESATAAIFDGDDCRGDEAESLARLAAALAPTPVLALLDFPRIDDHHRALAAGARAVLSKPFAVEDLFWRVDRVVSGEWQGASGE